MREMTPKNVFILSKYLNKPIEEVIKVTQKHRLIDSAACLSFYNAHSDWTIFDSNVIFKLIVTHGLPLDLLEMWCENHKVFIDDWAVERLNNKHSEVSRN